MRLLPSDPDIETIYSRIKSKDIDLQPNFQRGEVWSQSKQRRLIDSVLRDWHIPPVHLVQNAETGRQEVLDGQQRLVAIRDFINGSFTVDGNIQPIDPGILGLNGLRYAELPERWKRQFDQFTIRVFRIVDFRPEEPAELFFRLNQPVALTTAEQRNAFFGEVRTQVKELVTALSKVSFGFSNSRMALDDVVARTCISVENGTIAKKITAALMADRYRRRAGLKHSVMQICVQAVGSLVNSRELWVSNVKLNKATLFSWLWFSACSSQYFGNVTPELLAKSLALVESFREKLRPGEKYSEYSFSPKIVLPSQHMQALVELFQDRSTSRVSDVSSVIARDLFLWTTFGIVCTKEGHWTNGNPYFATLEAAMEHFVTDETADSDALLAEISEKLNWGILR